MIQVKYFENDNFDDFNIFSEGMKETLLQAKQSGSDSILSKKDVMQVHRSFNQIRESYRLQIKKMGLRFS